MKINLTCLTFWANTEHRHEHHIKGGGVGGQWRAESDGKCQKNI